MRTVFWIADAPEFAIGPDNEMVALFVVALFAAGGASGNGSIREFLDAIELGDVKAHVPLPVRFIFHI